MKIRVSNRRPLVVSKVPSTRELLARLRKFRGRLPAGFKFDCIEANQRLAWVF